MTAKLLVVALIALIGAAPISTSRHELTVRHVVCAEHGELTHVATSEGVGGESPQSTATASGQKAETLDGHEHCANGFVVRGRAFLAVVLTVARYVPPPMLVRDGVEPLACPGRVFVLASAPKTSPPIV